MNTALKARNFVRPMTKEDKHGWQGEIILKNGQRIDMSNVANIAARQTRLGTDLVYGYRPEGYDGFVIEEEKGGGSISVAHFFKDGVKTRQNLMIAALLEMRNGHEVLNLPRSFIKPGEQALTVAELVLLEEFGLASPFNTQPLGNHLNPNSAFFFNKEGEGCSFFSMEVDQRSLVLIPENGHFKFKNEVEPIDKDNASTKRLLASTFMPAHMILKHPLMDDMFTQAGIGLLKEALWPDD